MTFSPTGPPRNVFRETLRHTAVYSGAAVLGRMMSFIMLPFYAHILRDLGYGVIGMIDASLALLTSLMAYNFSGALIRIYHEQPDEDRKRLVVPTGTTLVAVIVFVIGGAGALASQPAASLLLGDGSYWNLVALALASFSFDMVGQTAQVLLVIKRRSGVYSLLALVRLFVGLSLNIALIVVLDWGLTGYFVSSLVTAIVSMGLAIVLMMRDVGWTWNRAIARDLLSFQLPLIPGAIASFASRQVERVVVRFQLDLNALGVLEMAYKFPTLIAVLVTMPFMRSWNTTRMEIADEPDARARIGSVFTHFTYITLLAFLILSVNIESVLRLLTPPEFWAAAFVARIEAAQMVVKGLERHLGFGLFYAKRTKDMAKIQGVVALVKVGASYAMISTFGLYGAAWSAFIASCVTLVWMTVLSNRYYRFEVNWKKIGFLVLAAAATNVIIDSFSPEELARWAQPAIEQTRSGVALLDGTWVAGVKDGRLLELLNERIVDIFDMLIRTCMLVMFVVVGPLVHGETRRRLLALLQRARQKVSRA